MYLDYMTHPRRFLPHAQRLMRRRGIQVTPAIYRALNHARYTPDWYCYVKRPVEFLNGTRLDPAHDYAVHTQNRRANYLVSSRLP